MASKNVYLTSDAFHRVSEALHPDAPSSAEVAEVLETVGRLAADLSHDLNNQLSIVINYSFVLQRALAKVPGAGTHMEELTRAAWRATNLVESLRLLGGPRMQKVEAIDLSQCVARMAPLLEHAFGDCELRLRLANPAPTVNAPLSQLERVVAAVALSLAAKAEESSLLTLQTDVDHAGRPLLHAWLDRGSGIAPRTERARKPLRRTDGRNGLDACGPLRRAFRLTGARATRKADMICVRFG